MHAYRVDVVSTPMCTGLTVNLISAKKKLGLHVKLIFLSFTKNFLTCLYILVTRPGLFAINSSSACHRKSRSGLINTLVPDISIYIFLYEDTNLSSIQLKLALMDLLH